MSINSINLNKALLLTPEYSDECYSSPINGTNAKGLYNPMQFVLRLRKDIQTELNAVNSGVHSTGSLTINQIQAFSTYLHETIHWWQHVGSNFGLISSLKFPSQAHIIHSDLKTVLKELGPFKSLAKFEKAGGQNNSITKILNYWHDIEFGGQIAFEPSRIFRISKNPYFECWGHSYNIMWSSAIWTLATTIDRELKFLPNIKEWEKEFHTLRIKKLSGFYHGSSNTIAPLGTKSIFEGQARFSQLQFLYQCCGGKVDNNDFYNAGMLSGIYVDAFNTFLSILGESFPLKADDSLIALFLLVCDIAMNPTDGFPFNITHYESFLITNDPGYRFVLICQMIRDKNSKLKNAIQHYSKDEYIHLSELLSRSISCFSPFESAAYILSWIKQETSINDLLEQESNYEFSPENLPIKLFFSKFLRFQEDRVKTPQVFCWPGMNLAESKYSSVSLPEMLKIFEAHKALFMDDAEGIIYHSASNRFTETKGEKILNEFYSWNSVYTMVREWIIAEGPFSFNYEWLTSKYSKAEMIDWVSNNFENSFDVRPVEFNIL